MLVSLLGVDTCSGNTADIGIIFDVGTSTFIDVGSCVGDSQHQW